VNALKQIGMESVCKARTATLSIKQEKTRGHGKEENKIGRVQAGKHLV
jgi:hypothetical protein